MGNLNFRNIEKSISTPVTIEILNDDCLFHIFKYLLVADRLSFGRVNRRWRSVSQNSWNDFKFLDFHPKTWGEESEKIYKMKKSRLTDLVKLSGKYITSVNFDLKSENNPSKYLKSQAIITILKNCPNITELLILNMEPMDRQDFKIFMELLLSISHNITKFGMTIHPDNSTDEDFSKIFAKMVNLKLISLENINKPFQGTCLLSLPSGIEEIHIRHTADFENVETLRLMILNAKNLRTLGFTLTPDLNFNFLLDVLKLKAETLTKLIINYCSWKPHNPVRLLSTMSELINLETLDVQCTSFVNDLFLDTVATNCKKLKDLRIAESNDVTDAGIRRITRLKNLNCLIMSRLSSIVSPKLKNLKNIKILDCSSSSSLQEDSVISLIHIANDLEYLNVLNCPNFTEKFMQEVSIALKRRKRRTKLFVNVEQAKISCKAKRKDPNKLPVILDTYSFF